jgi:4-carboxymuconolactone decarboxylase
MWIPLPADAELAPETLAALGSAPPLNVFRMVARAPASLPPFIELARSSYAFGQHLALAKLVGVTDAEIAAVVAPAPADLDEECALACRVADEITRDVRLSDEALALAVARFGERRATELVLCCSYFNMVSRFLESTRVPLDVFGVAS